MSMYLVTLTIGVNPGGLGGRDPQILDWGSFQGVVNGSRETV